MDNEQLQQEPQPARIKRWSFSGLKLFEQCPYAAKLRYVDKLPSPEHTDENHPLVRGSRLHQAAEDYITGKRNDLPKPLDKFADDYGHLREAYGENRVRVEEEWGYDCNLAETSWRDKSVWLLVKVDAIEFVDEGAAVLVDLKTGKKYGNEVKHNQQGQLYAIAAFLRFPKLDSIRVEFWYPDQQGKKTSKYYDRQAIAKYLPRWIDKGVKVTTTTSFPPKPNCMNCKFCDYGVQTGTGECVYAVEAL